mmetsp:Transcript_20745/g.67188  ORF Transcript_20745/g.67188 Transcript_20745/m.67188 type:complete len:344 (+) Transcript_20745:76-1107(+)
MRGTDLGRSVMSASGSGVLAPPPGEILYLRSISASTSFASSIANPVPMHTRGPAPKGTYAPCVPIPRSAPSTSRLSSTSTSSPSLGAMNHRSGRNSSASPPHLRGSRWRRYGETRTVVPAGRRLLPPVAGIGTSAARAAQRPTRYAGGRSRIASSTAASISSKSDPNGDDDDDDEAEAPPPALSASAAQRSCTSGAAASAAHVHPRTIALVSCPATSSVMSSSRRARSSIPVPSSSRAANSRSSKSEEAAEDEEGVLARFFFCRRSRMRLYTTSSSRRTAKAYWRLSGVGAHSGSANPIAALRPKNSNASAIAATMVRALCPRMSAPKSARAAMRSVRSLKSG